MATTMPVSWPRPNLRPSQTTPRMAVKAGVMLLRIAANDADRMPVETEHERERQRRERESQERDRATARSGQQVHRPRGRQQGEGRTRERDTQEREHGGAKIRDRESG